MGDSETKKAIEEAMEYYYVMGFKSALVYHKIPFSEDTVTVAKARFHEFQSMIEKVGKLSPEELELLEKIGKEDHLSDEEKDKLK